jgi:hypothetical protein
MLCGGAQDGILLDVYLFRRSPTVVRLTQVRDCGNCVSTQHDVHQPLDHQVHAAKITPLLPVVYAAVAYGASPIPSFWVVRVELKRKPGREAKTRACMTYQHTWAHRLCFAHQLEVPKGVEYLTMAFRHPIHVGCLRSTLVEDQGVHI